MGQEITEAQEKLRVFYRKINQLGRERIGFYIWEGKNNRGIAPGQHWQEWSTWCKNSNYTTEEAQYNLELIHLDKFRGEFIPEEQRFKEGVIVDFIGRFTRTGIIQGENSAGVRGELYYFGWLKNGNADNSFIIQPPENSEL